MTYDVNTPAVARLWPYHPDWSSGFEVTRAFLTDVITSRSNTEQRRALRDAPRLSARYKAVVQDAHLRAANHFLRARQNDPVAVPDFSRHALTTGASLAAATTLTLASPPPWVADSFLAVLCSSTAMELVRITDVTGATITLASGLDNAWPSGSVLRPAIHGLLSGQMAGPRYHRGAAALEVQVSAYPGGEPVEDEGTAGVTFNDYEVFPTIEPDWAGQPALTYLWPVEQVDFGVGRTAQFRPVDLAQRLTEAQFNIAKADAVTLEQMFLRMKGRRGGFYRATGEKDFALAANTSAVAYFDAEGTDLYDDFGSVDYAENPAAIEIVKTDGTRTHKLITGITLSGGNSRVAFSGALTLTTATVARISWMPLVRFASDDLTTLWRTPVQAQIRCGFLEIRPRAEPAVDPGIGGAVPDSGPRRHWRVYNRVVKNISASYQGLNKLEFRTTAGGANEASGITPSYSDTPHYVSGNPVNGGQVQLPGLSEGWVAVDFGEGNEQEIIEVAYAQTTYLNVNRTFAESDVQYSDDGLNWTTAWSISNETWSGTTQVEFTRPDIEPSRYCRIRSDSLVAGNKLGLSEVELRETPAGADQASGGTAIGRSVQGGTFYSDAFDDDVTTDYKSLDLVQTDIEWIGYDFGSGVTKDIGEIVMTALDDSDQPTDYEMAPTAGWIEISPDGLAWRCTGTFAGLSWSPGASNTVTLS